MNSRDWQLLIAGLVYLVALVFAACGAWSRPLPIDVYVLSFGLAFTAYFLIVRLLAILSCDGQSPATSVARFLLIIAIAVRLCMLFAPHRENSDVWRYVWDGHLVTCGINPYRYAPSSSELDEFRDSEIYENLNPAYNDLSTVYGPVAMFWFSLTRLLPGEPVENMRALMVLGDLLTIVLLTLATTQSQKLQSWVLLYALNPLLIDSFAQRGQMEGVLLPWLVLAFYFAILDKWKLAGVALGLAIATKISLVIVLPVWIVYLFKTSLVNAYGFGVGLVGVSLLAAIPYLMVGVESLSGYSEYAVRWKSNGSLFSVFEWMVGDGWARLGAVLSCAMLVSAVAIRKLRVGNDGLNSLAESSLISLLVLLLFSPAVFPWYLCWMLPMLPLMVDGSNSKWLIRAVMLWSFTSMTWYFRFLVYEPTTSGYFESFQGLLVNAAETSVEPWRWIEYLPVFTLLAIWLFSSRSNGNERSKLLFMVK